jgi:tight adherence protein B
MTDLRTYELSRTDNSIIILSSALAGLVISYLMYRNVLFSVVIVPLIPRIRSAVQASLAERRRQRYMDEFKDFLFMVSTSIGAGRSMKDAIAESIPSLTSIHGSRCVLAGELSKAYERMEVGRENDVTVLMDLAAASGSEDVYDFVTIYSICKTTGASLITALSRAASVIIDKMTIEREVQELVKRKKSEGMIIFVMPVIVILFLNLCAPDYIAPLYETLAGRLIMTGVIISIAGIYSIIQKIVKIEI